MDQKQYGNTQIFGQKGTATRHTVVSVEEAHHPLYDGNIGFAAIAIIESGDMLPAHHESIQIHRFRSACKAVILRIDIVGTAFERLHFETAPSKQS